MSLNLKHHSMYEALLDTTEPSCEPAHDTFALLLSSVLCVGLVISYLPQHVRIISKGSSEGFSPLFLLLGSTSSAAGMLNVVTLQWGLLRCCRSISAGSCFESTIGILQVILQWLLFTVIVMLYLIYFPRHMKYQRLQPVIAHEDDEDIEAEEETQLATTGEWREAVALCSISAIHLITCCFVTFFIVLTSPSELPPGESTKQAELWAGFLGVSSMVLAAWQYAPQLWKTYHVKLVGALSISTMCIQTPGSVLFCISLAIRPGTNWTSWLTYAVTGVMQGTLLVMCLCWKSRQHRLNIDDFGNPLLNDIPEPETVVTSPENGAVVEEDAPAVTNGRPADESTPLIVNATSATGKLVLPAWFRRGR